MFEMKIMYNFFNFLSRMNAKKSFENSNLAHENNFN